MERTRTVASDREERITVGVMEMEQWMSDLIHGGLASLSDGVFFQERARRLMDARAPGLARQVRALGALVGAGPDWQERLLYRLGRLALTTRAWQLRPQLPPALREELYTMVGVPLTEGEVRARGDQHVDRWMVVGASEEDEDALRVRRTWIYGCTARRPALFLQFAAADEGFDPVPEPGTVFEAALCFWPGARALRALPPVEYQLVSPLPRMPGFSDFTSFLSDVADVLAVAPWRDRFLCVVRDVVPTSTDDRVYLVDRQGAALPLTNGPHWNLRAAAGGRGVDIAAEWNGELLRPLSVIVDESCFLV